MEVEIDMMFMKVKEGAQTKTVKGKEKGKEMDSPERNTALLPSVDEKATV